MACRRSASSRSTTRTCPSSSFRACSVKSAPSRRDFPAILAWLNELGAHGIDNVPAHLAARPDEAGAVAEKLHVLDANQAMIALLEARSRAELLGGFEQRLGSIADAPWTVL